jgi:hypothetical protein
MRNKTLVKANISFDEENNLLTKNEQIQLNEFAKKNLLVHKRILKKKENENKYNKRDENVFSNKLAFSTKPINAKASSLSTANIGIMNPFLNQTTLNINSPILGIDNLNGSLFRYDPWDLYNTKLISSHGLLVFGLMGYGKSMFAKNFAWNEILYGRQVIVTTDPKGEWNNLSNYIDGSQNIKLGGIGKNAVCINPLDAGIKPDNVLDIDWLEKIKSSRLNSLSAVISIMRGQNKEFSPTEYTCLSLTLDYLNKKITDKNPTLKDVYEVFKTPPLFLQKEIDNPLIFKELKHSLHELVNGSLSSMFSSDSNISLNPNAPLITVDTSVLASLSEKIKSIASECINSWVLSTLRSQDGHFRLIILEEGWEAFSDPYRINTIDEMIRLASIYRCATMLIFHQLSDATQFGDSDSAHRNRLKGIFDKCETQIMFKCSNKEKEVISDLLEIPDEQLTQVTRLSSGICLFKIGNTYTSFVHPVISNECYEIFNTDAGRSG